MPLAAILLYIRLAALIFTYGLKLVKWFKERHDKIEQEAKVTAMTSDAKAKLFNKGAAHDIMHAEKRVAPPNELNEIREAVWSAHNPGKVPKPLKSSALKVRRPVGKTA